MIHRATVQGDERNEAGKGRRIFDGRPRRILACGRSGVITIITSNKVVFVLLYHCGFARIVIFICVDEHGVAVGRHCRPWWSSLAFSHFVRL